ncbi:hypothetical protein D5018_21505 [Parashewanella curva]|uniref:Type I restriction modification DNA specificity domain-containing protein n=1 Tax=Parashewanella curva TaxID=2338552 RepID=A0A3L8PSS8_9GAMM|nr:hypothetical protein D5018_21505 [Parashewanella curva]
MSQSKDESLRKGKLKLNDIVLTTRGSVGHFAYYNESVNYQHLRINSGMVLIRCASKEIDTNYLYSALRSKIVQNQLASLSFGSAQPQLTVRDINNFVIRH